MGYTIEIFVSLIPMLFCQIFNNFDTEGEVSFIQKSALWMKLGSIILLILELTLMIIEVKKAKEMKELNIGLPEMSEEDRRSKYGKFMAYVSFIIMGLFMVILVIGIAAQKEGRICVERQALESAVCVDCVEAACMDCEGDSKVCKQCEVGFILNADGKCVDCDDQEYVACQECEITGDSVTCT